MTGKESRLEKRLSEDKSKSKVSMKTNLRDFARILRNKHHTAKRKDVVLNRAVCMLSRLYDGNDSGNLVPRQIHTVGELYSFTDKEFYWFRGYGRKTWLKLNEWLPKYGFPPVKLPQEYTAEK